MESVAASCPLAVWHEQTGERKKGRGWDGGWVVGWEKLVLWSLSFHMSVLFMFQIQCLVFFF